MRQKPVAVTQVVAVLVFGSPNSVDALSAQEGPGKLGAVLTHLVGGNAPSSAEGDATIMVEQRVEIDQALYGKPVDELELSFRTTSALLNADYVFLGQLAMLTEDAILYEVRYCGKAALREIEDVLHEHSLELGMKLVPREVK